MNYEDICYLIGIIGIFIIEITICIGAFMANVFLGFIVLGLVAIFTAGIFLGIEENNDEWDEWDE